MSNALVRSLPPAEFPAQMAALRRNRGMSLRHLARSAGVSHDTLGAWERGVRLPRLPELEATLTALGVDAAERLRLVALLPVPRARHHVRAAGAAASGGWGSAAGPLPGGGDLLRAMRGRRGLTQAEAARSAGVSQGRLMHWEQSEEWPSVERLHMLCFALGASPEEVMALTGGRGTLPAWSEAEEAEEAEAWDCKGGTASPHDPLGRLIQRVYFQVDALRDLRWLSLGRALWLRAQDTEAFRSHLHDAYAYRAKGFNGGGSVRGSQRVCRPDRGTGAAGVRPVRVLDMERDRLGQGAAPRHFRASPSACRRRRAAGLPDAAGTAEGNQAWMLCELSLALAEAGRDDEALRACTQAREMAEQDAVPQEVLFRRRDHAALLAALGRYAEALDVLEAAASLWHYGDDPAVRHHLLAATCHLGLGNEGAAQDCLAPAFALIDGQAECGDAQIVRLRPQAEALAARL